MNENSLYGKKNNHNKTKQGIFFLSCNGKVKNLFNLEGAQLG